MRFILREQGSGTRNTLDTALKDAGLPEDYLTVIAYVEDTRSILEMVANGMGQAVVSDLEAQKGLEEGLYTAYPIEALSRPREFFFVHHSDHKNSAANRLFFTFVKEYFQDPANLPTHPAPEALEDMP